jgi:chaperone required for assembly of F1-ATPase
MKHWIEFLDKKTHDTKRLGKIANSVLFEKQQKEIELKGLEESLQSIQSEILAKLEPNYSNTKAMVYAMVQAKSKADKWNATPTNELQNPNKTE